MIGFLICNQWRQSKAFLRSNWALVVFAGLAIALGADAVAAELGRVATVDCLIQPLFAAFIVYLSVFRRYPQVRFEPAFLMFCRASKCFAWVVIAKVVMAFVGYCLVMGVVILLCGQSLSLMNYAAMLFGLVAASCLGWSRYNSQAHLLVYIGVCVAQICAYLLEGTASLMVSASVIGVSVAFPPEVKTDKFLRDLTTITRSQAAFSKMDAASLHEIAQECATRQRYTVTFVPLAGNAVLGKAFLVDSLRASRAALLLCGGLICLDVFIAAIDFSFAGFASCTAHALFLNVLQGEYCQHIRGFMAKMRQGLLLPLSFRDVAKGIVPVPIALTTIGCCCIGAVGRYAWWWVLVVWLVSVVSIVLCHAFTARYPSCISATRGFVLIGSLVSGILLLGY